MSSFAAMKLSQLSIGGALKAARAECTSVNYNKMLDRNIEGYYNAFVKTGSIAPYFHFMGMAGIMSAFVLYPYALEEQIEKNPHRFIRGQNGLTMKDYLSADAEHHFTPVLATTVQLTTGH